MSWSDELELESGGYSRVERAENAEPRRIRRGSCLAQLSAERLSVDQEHDAIGSWGRANT